MAKLEKKLRKLHQRIQKKKKKERQICKNVIIEAAKDVSGLEGEEGKRRSGMMNAR
jgi:hypothetical protein